MNLQKHLISTILGVLISTGFSTYVDRYYFRGYEQPKSAWQQFFNIDPQVIASRAIEYLRQADVIQSLQNEIDNNRHLQLGNFFKPKGIHFSRTIETFFENSSTAEIQLNFDEGCVDADEYGLNDCHFLWGSTISGDASISLNTTLDENDVIGADLTLLGVIPFQFECAACGANCTIALPALLGLDAMSVELPPCRDIFQFDNSTIFSFQLPANNPLPLAIPVVGSVYLKNGGDYRLKANVDLLVK